MPDLAQARPFAAAKDAGDMPKTRAAGWWDVTRQYFDRRRQRRALRDLALLNSHLLGDVGLSREAALAEAAKRFWVP